MTQSYFKKEERFLLPITLFQTNNTMKRKQAKSNANEDVSLLRSCVYNEYLAEREEILKHKWIESEKVGHDIGYDRALLDWIMNHREKWRKSHRRKAHA